MKDLTSTSFDKHLDDMLTAIDVLRKKDLLVPSLITLYSTIDVMAWLSRPKSNPDVTRTDFVNWVDLYLLPGSSLNCSALDLYSARCSVVHSYTFESRLSRARRAKQIWYSWGIVPTAPLEQAISRNNANAVAINVDMLRYSLILAINKFRHDIKRKNSLRKLVYGRATQYFFSIVPVKRAGLA